MKIFNNMRIYPRDGPPSQENQASSFKRYLPQVLANFAINLMMADGGLALSYPTLVIGYLMDVDNPAANQTKDEFLQLKIFKHFTMTKLQSSIYSSLQFISIPIGCLIAGSIIDRAGRKKVMFLARIPMLASWIMNFLSQNLDMLLVASLLSGLSIGLGEPAIATYQGEVTEPAIRGALINFAIFWLVVSLLGPYLLHLVVPSWRWISLMFSVMSIVAGIVALLVPESPSWLLSKGHVTLAEKSLKKLRGGATKREIEEEMQDMVSYHYSSISSCNNHSSISSKENLFIRENLREKWNYFKSSKIRRPFILSCIMFLLVYTTGVSMIRPYTNIVLKMIHFNGNWTTIGTTITLAGVVGNIIAFLTVGFTGKRIIVLSSLSLNGLGAMAITVGVMRGWSVYTSLVALHLMYFVNGYGITPVPWILQSELYPFRGRGFVAGLAAGISYFIGFIALFIFLPVLDLITIQGMFFLFFLFSIFGFIFMYFKLPETEGRTLEQIEQFFADKQQT